MWGVGWGMWGVGCGVWGVGCRVWGVGCGGLIFRGQDKELLWTWVSGARVGSEKMVTFYGLEGWGQGWSSRIDLTVMNFGCWALIVAVWTEAGGFGCRVQTGRR